LKRFDPSRSHRSSLALAAVTLLLARAGAAEAAGERRVGFVALSPTQNLSLSACGTLDWVTWQSPTPDNIAPLGWDVSPIELRKRGTPLISPLKFVGVQNPPTAAEYWGSTTSVTNYTWTDGPSGAGSSRYGVVMGAEQNFGVSISVPANFDTRQLDIYYECRGSVATFTVQITETDVMPACLANVSGVQRFRIFWFDPDNPLVVSLTGGSAPSGQGPALFAVTLNEQVFPYGVPPLLTEGCDPSKVASGTGGAGGAGGGSGTCANSSGRDGGTGGAGAAIGAGGAGGAGGSMGGTCALFGQVCSASVPCCAGEGACAPTDPMSAVSTCYSP